MVFCCFFFVHFGLLSNVQHSELPCVRTFLVPIVKVKTQSFDTRIECMCVRLSIYLSIHLYIQYIFSIICVHVVRKCLLYLQLDIFEGVRFTYATFIECVFEIDCCMSWLCNYFFEAGYYCWFAVTNVRQLSSLLAVCHRACLMHR